MKSVRDYAMASVGDPIGDHPTQEMRLSNSRLTCKLGKTISVDVIFGETGKGAALIAVVIILVWMAVGHPPFVF
jgi:hypothetical protein